MPYDERGVSELVVVGPKTRTLFLHDKISSCLIGINFVKKYLAVESQGLRVVIPSELFVSLRTRN